MRKLSMIALIALVTAALGLAFSVSAFACGGSCGQGHEGAQASAQHEGHGMTDMQKAQVTPGEVQVAPDQHALMKTVYSDYFAVGSTLARDSMDNVKVSSAHIANKLDGFLEMDSDSEQPNPLLRDIQASAGKLAEKNDIAAARAEFGNLSEELVEYQNKFVTDKSEKAHVFYCDMVKKPWLQQEAQIANPYYGASMLKCGREIK